MIPGCRARPINEGNTDRGASSPAKPAVVRGEIGGGGRDNKIWKMSKKGNCRQGEHSCGEGTLGGYKGGIACLTPEERDSVPAMLSVATAGHSSPNDEISRLRLASGSNYEATIENAPRDCHTWFCGPKEKNPHTQDCHRASQRD